ncbi:uncharacterized protein KIAA1143 homolog [Ptychodera flava]|uniref:uncharacterized protein KIAA1143 homolog n=1 Tax=Ptychodera flava TaxID=63121 RepID=UPI00396A0191
MAGRRNVAYTKPSEPTFLSKFKEKIGYKEGPTIDTKKQSHPEDDDSYSDEDNRPENEDERPTIVALKEGDLSQEEAEHYAKVTGKKLEDLGKDDSPADGKIKFRKPAKRSSSDTSELNASSSKKKKDSKDKDEKKNSAKKVKNASLLSFDDEEEG